MLLTIATTLIYIEFKELVGKKIFTEITKKFWGDWELRLLFVLSLVLQLLQVIFGYIRPRYIGKRLPYVAIIVWLVYLLADWMATLVLTTLLRGDKLDNKFIVFWTPFILCHLGSPHNITAYSLEDNDLWLRHFFGLFLQVGESIYIYANFRSRSNFALNALAVPIFVAGIIKYGERVWALRCASDKQLVNSLFSIPDNKIDGGGKNVRIGLSKVNVDNLFKKKGVVPQVNFIRQAYSSFNIFNPLFVDLPFRLSREFHDNRVHMESKSAEDAFKFVDVELSFVYDMFFTKNPVQYRNLKVSIGLRSLCLASVICSLIAFTMLVDRRHDSSVDIGITYLLLVGAISLDVYSFCMHAVSTWAMTLLPIPYKVHKMYARLVAYRTRSIKANYGIKLMAQHDLIKYSVRANPSSFAGATKFFDTGNLLQKYGYTRWKPVDHDLKNFIYAHLQKKRRKCESFSFRMDELEKLLNEKGDHVLTQKSEEMFGFKEEFLDLFPRSDPTYFVRSIFLWHIATALTYYDDRDNHRAADSFRNISKSLSDYMMYVALVRPGMLCKGFTDVINRKIYQEALGLLCTRSLRQFTRDLLQFVSYQNLSNFYHPPQDKVGALLEGARFALKLQKLVREMQWDVDEKWELLSEVWMEMMTYAASHCPWREHVQQLRHGGELLTHVALIMAHLGLSTKVGIDEPDEDSDDALPPFHV